MSKHELTTLFQKHVNETKCIEMSDPGMNMDYREFAIFVCTRFINWLKEKNRVDGNLTPSQLIENLCS